MLKSRIPHYLWVRMQCFFGVHIVSLYWNCFWKITIQNFTILECCHMNAKQTENWYFNECLCQSIQSMQFAVNTQPNQYHHKQKNCWGCQTAFFFPQLVDIKFMQRNPLQILWWNHRYSLLKWISKMSFIHIANSFKVIKLCTTFWIYTLNSLKVIWFF